MAINTQSTVVAVFNSASEAQAAVSELKSSGFSSSEVFMSSNAPASGGMAERETGVTGYDTGSATHEGGVKGWFKSLFGGDSDTETGYEEDRPYYETAASSGNCFVSVEVDENNLDRAADILNRHSPVDIHREAGTSTSGSTTATGTPATTGRTGLDTSDTVGGAQSIPVVQEELQVGKRAVLRGGVRVYSRIVEQPVEENIQLREERVTVERTPVNRATTEADLRPGQEKVFEVKEYAEEAVVGKTARVVEEVRIRKDASERTETVRDTVRNTEVNVENIADAGSRTASQASGTSQYIDDADFRNDFATRYASQGGSYDTYGPSYEYGYTMANDPRYRGRSFSDVESDLRSDYGSRYPNSTWEKMKDSVRYGWDKLTNKV